MVNRSLQLHGNTNFSYNQHKKDQPLKLPNLHYYLPHKRFLLAQQEVISPKLKIQTSLVCKPLSRKRNTDRSNSNNISQSKQPINLTIRSSSQIIQAKQYLVGNSTQLSSIDPFALDRIPHKGSATSKLNKNVQLKALTKEITQHSSDQMQSRYESDYNVNFIK